MSQKIVGENVEKWGNFHMTGPKFPMISFPIFLHFSLFYAIGSPPNPPPPPPPPFHVIDNV